MIRRGRLGLLLSDDPLPLVRAVSPESPAARAGVLAGDLLSLPRAQLSRCRAGVSLSLDITRGGAPLALTLTPDALPEESYEGLSVRYGELVRDGLSLRTIWVGGDAPKATVLYAQGVELGSVERAGVAPGDPLRGLVEGLARRGYAVTRVERRGVGDSEGEHPGDVPWELHRGDLAAALSETPGEQVFLLGHSLGAMHAVALAGRDPRVRGVMAYGAGIDPWRSYLAVNLQRQLALAGEGEAQELAGEVMGCWRALLDGADAREALAALSDRARLWCGLDGDGRLHGRSLGFWRAVDAELPEEGVSSLGSSLLAMWGESDWLSGREEHVRMAALARGRFCEVRKADHGFADFASAEDSYRARGRGVWQPAVAEAMAGWLDQLAVP